MRFMALAFLWAWVCGGRRTEDFCNHGMEEYHLSMVLIARSACHGSAPSYSSAIMIASKLVRLPCLQCVVLTNYSITAKNFSLNSVLQLTSNSI